MRDDLKRNKIIILKLMVILTLIILAVYSCETKCSYDKANKTTSESTSDTIGKNSGATVTGPAQARVVSDEG